MRIFILLLLVLAVSCTNCRWDAYEPYEAAVNELINEQIAVELKGQYTYLQLSNIFLRANSFYPKVAKYFRAKSDEEMGHAEQFIDYQNRRGGTFKISSVERKTDGSCASVETPLDGFKCARELENDVTSALTDLLAEVSDLQPATSYARVENPSESLLLGQSVLVTAGGQTKSLQSFDCNREITKVEFVELSEMIAHDFLGHQIIDTKELANIEATLTRFAGNNAEIGAFLADKHLEL